MKYVGDRGRRSAAIRCVLAAQSMFRRDPPYVQERPLGPSGGWLRAPGVEGESRQEPRHADGGPSTPRAETSLHRLEQPVETD